MGQGQGQGEGIYGYWQALCISKVTALCRQQNKKQARPLTLSSIIQIIHTNLNIKNIHVER